MLRGRVGGVLAGCVATALPLCRITVLRVSRHCVARVCCHCVGRCVVAAQHTYHPTSQHTRNTVRRHTAMHPLVNPQHTHQHSPRRSPDTLSDAPGNTPSTQFSHAVRDTLFRGVLGCQPSTLTDRSAWISDAVRTNTLWLHSLPSSVTRFGTGHSAIPHAALPPTSSTSSLVDAVDGSSSIEPQTRPAAHHNGDYRPSGHKTHVLCISVTAKASGGDGQAWRGVRSS